MDGRDRRALVREILRDKKTWFASFLVCWAAALQAHINWVKKQDTFIDKFGTPEQKEALKAKHEAAEESAH
ncbi:uncharacterized protein LOC116254747 [Nymphaea colorata]|nr:uncharacterized protein LOC116254747 [Nymphaea colorata]